MEFLKFLGKNSKINFTPGTSVTITDLDPDVDKKKKKKKKNAKI